MHQNKPSLLGYNNVTKNQIIKKFLSGGQKSPLEMNNPVGLL